MTSPYTNINYFPNSYYNHVKKKWILKRGKPTTPKMTALRIGEKIKKAREEQGFTKSKIAEMAKCVPSTILHLENGENVGIDTILDVCNILKLKLKIY